MSQYYVNPGVSMNVPISNWNGWGKTYPHNMSSLHGGEYAEVAGDASGIMPTGKNLHYVRGNRPRPQGDYIDMGFFEAGIQTKHIGAAAGAYHGMQRYGTKGAIVWGLAGYLFPLITVGAAVLQGYAKKSGSGGIVDKVVSPVLGKPSMRGALAKAR